MASEENKVVDGLYYTKEHEWAKLEGDVATIGISDYAQHHLGDIVFVELPEMGKKCNQGEEVCVVESAKAVASVYAPLSGEVVEVNESAKSNPASINKDTYNAWIAKLKITNPAEKSNLMDSAKYREYLAQLSVKK